MDHPIFETQRMMAEFSYFYRVIPEEIIVEELSRAPIFNRVAFNRAVDWTLLTKKPLQAAMGLQGSTIRKIARVAQVNRPRRVCRLSLLFCLASTVLLVAYLLSIGVSIVILPYSLAKERCYT